MLEALNAFPHLNNMIYMKGKCLCFHHKCLFYKHAVGTQSGWIRQKGEFTGQVLESSEIVEQDRTTLNFQE